MVFPYGKMRVLLNYLVLPFTSFSRLRDFKVFKTSSFPRFQAYRDFIEPKKSILNLSISVENDTNSVDSTRLGSGVDWEQLKFGSGTHGRNVLIKLAGKGKRTGEQYGFASGANFYLARTENGSKAAL